MRFEPLALRLRIYRNEGFLLCLIPRDHHSTSSLQEHKDPQALLTWCCNTLQDNKPTSLLRPQPLQLQRIKDLLLDLRKMAHKLISRTNLDEEEAQSYMWRSSENVENEKPSLEDIGYRNVDQGEFFFKN